MTKLVFVVKCNGLYWTGRNHAFWSADRADAFEYGNLNDATAIHKNRLGVEIVESVSNELRNKILKSGLKIVG